MILTSPIIQSIIYLSLQQEEGKIISQDAVIKLESQKHNYFLSELIEEGINIERKKSSSSAEVGDDCKKDKDCKS